MTTQVNKELVQQLAAASPREDIDRIAQILSPQLAWYPGGAREPMGRDEFLAGLAAGARAFADATFTIEDIVAEGDRVAIRATYRGRHVGEFQGIEPTGRTVTFRSDWFYRIVDGRIVEAWNLDQEFLSQLR